MLKTAIWRKSYKAQVVNELRNAPFWSAKRRVLQGDMCRFARRNVPFRNAKRHRPETKTMAAVFSCIFASKATVQVPAPIQAAPPARKQPAHTPEPRPGGGNNARNHFLNTVKNIMIP